jgi:hypothetical protein
MENAGAQGCTISSWLYLPSREYLSQIQRFGILRLEPFGSCRLYSTLFLRAYGDALIGNIVLWIYSLSIPSYRCRVVHSFKSCNTKIWWRVLECSLGWPSAFMLGERMHLSPAAEEVCHDKWLCRLLLGLFKVRDFQNWYCFCSKWLQLRCSLSFSLFVPVTVTVVCLLILPRYFDLGCWFLCCYDEIRLCEERHVQQKLHAWLAWGMTDR